MELGFEPRESCSGAEALDGWAMTSPVSQQVLLGGAGGHGEPFWVPRSRQPWLHPPHPSCTFALPVGMRSKADVTAVLAVELRHERLVGVADEQDGGIEGLDLLLAALVRLDAYGPAAAPVVPLAFEPCHRQGGGQGGEPRDVSPAQSPRPPQESSHLHSFPAIFTEHLLCAGHCADVWE